MALNQYGLSVSEMFELVKTYVDDVINENEVTRLLNIAQNRLEVEMKLGFPPLVSSSAQTANPTQYPTTRYVNIPVWDSDHHGVLPLFAAAMLKSKDSALSEKNSYLQQYESMVSNFYENYDPPVQWRSDNYTEQFRTNIASGLSSTELTSRISGSEYKFTIAKRDFNASYGNLQVFVNSLPVTFRQNNNDFYIAQSLISAGSYVTALWDINSNYNFQPSSYVGW